MFIVPADTFDNVKGKFPIGFKIWNTNKKEIFSNVICDIYDKNSIFIGTKSIFSLSKGRYINKFISIYKSTNENNIGFMDGINGNDFQHNNIVYILNTKEQLPNPRGIWINRKNIIPITIYFSVRKAIPSTWLNDRDQFLKPNINWESDLEFQNDCLAFTIFSNNIQSKFGTNYWIPFAEQELNAKNRFESHFMTDFINGKIQTENETNLFGTTENQSRKREFSEEAKDVFDAGRELWKYYHSQPSVNVNASLYDIREYFQGRNDKGIMNSKSDDSKYMELIGELRKKLNFLADKIKPKIYEYEFLKE